MKKVRIFVDYWNFELSWRETVGGDGPRIDWNRLPDLVLKRMAEKKLISPSDADLRGITVYASTHPEPSPKQKEHEDWLHFTLDQKSGYTVKTCTRQRQPCDHRVHEYHFVEKGVDTMLVCDLLSLAMRDLYEVGVVISDDSDLVPSIESVQDVLDRQIVHVGFRDSGKLVRSAAWAHILVDDLRPALERPRPAKKPLETVMGLAMKAARAAPNDGPRRNGC